MPVPNQAMPQPGMGINPDDKLRQYVMAALAHAMASTPDPSLLQTYRQMMTPNGLAELRHSLRQFGGQFQNLSMEDQEWQMLGKKGVHTWTLISSSPPHVYYASKNRHVYGQKAAQLIANAGGSSSAAAPKAPEASSAPKPIKGSNDGDAATPAEVRGAAPKMAGKQTQQGQQAAPQAQQQPRAAGMAPHAASPGASGPKPFAQLSSPEIKTMARNITTPGKVPDQAWAKIAQHTDKTLIQGNPDKQRLVSMIIRHGMGQHDPKEVYKGPAPQQANWQTQPPPVQGQQPQMPQQQPVPPQGKVPSQPKQSSGPKGFEGMPGMTSIPKGEYDSQGNLTEAGRSARLAKQAMQPAVKSIWPGAKVSHADFDNPASATAKGFTHRFTTEGGATYLVKDGGASRRLKVGNMDKVTGHSSRLHFVDGKEAQRIRQFLSEYGDNFHEKAGVEFRNGQLNLVRRDRATNEEVGKAQPIKTIPASPGAHALNVWQSQQGPGRWHISTPLKDIGRLDGQPMSQPSAREAAIAKTGAQPAKGFKVPKDEQEGQLMADRLRRASRATQKSLVQEPAQQAAQPIESKPSLSPETVKAIDSAKQLGIHDDIINASRGGPVTNNIIMRSLRSKHGDKLADLDDKALASMVSSVKNNSQIEAEGQSAPKQPEAPAAAGQAPVPAGQEVTQAPAAVPAPQAAAATPPVTDASADRPQPEWLKEDQANRVEHAKKIGVHDDIVAAAKTGKMTASEILSHIKSKHGDKLTGLDHQDLIGMVRAVRNKAGIAALDQPADERPAPKAETPKLVPPTDTGPKNRKVFKKPKKARTWTDGGTVFSAIMNRGGLDPEILKKNGYDVKALQEHGLTSLIRSKEKGGQSWDEIAQSLESEGLIGTVPENTNPFDHVLDLLRNKAKTAIADFDTDTKAESEAYEDAQREALADGYTRAALEEDTRAGEAEAQAEFDKEVAEGTVGQSPGEEVQGDAAEVEGDTSFDFGANAPEEPAHEPEPDQTPESIPGGKADDIPESAFPEAKISEGAKVESEHTSEPKVAQEIARDHLAEDPNYYEKLKKIESQPDLMKDIPSHHGLHDVVKQTPDQIDAMNDEQAALFASEAEKRGVISAGEVPGIGEIKGYYGPAKAMLKALAAKVQGQQAGPAPKGKAAPAPAAPAKPAPKSEPVSKPSPKAKSFDEFEKEYRDAFAKLNKYTPDQIGWKDAAEEMARLHDEHPDWADKIENLPEPPKPKAVKAEPTASTGNPAKDIYDKVLKDHKSEIPHDQLLKDIDATFKGKSKAKLTEMAKGMNVHVKSSHSVKDIQDRIRQQILDARSGAQRQAITEGKSQQGEPLKPVEPELQKTPAPEVQAQSTESKPSPKPSSVKGPKGTDTLSAILQGKGELDDRKLYRGSKLSPEDFKAAMKHLVATGSATKQVDGDKIIYRWKGVEPKQASAKSPEQIADEGAVSEASGSPPRDIPPPASVERHSKAAKAIGRTPRSLDKVLAEMGGDSAEAQQTLQEMVEDGNARAIKIGSSVFYELTPDGEKLHLGGSKKKPGFNMEAFKLETPKGVMEARRKAVEEMKAGKFDKVEDDDWLSMSALQE